MPTASLKVLFVTSLVCIAFVIAYGFLGIAPHPFIQVVIIVAPLVAAIKWLQTDARARRVSLVHDIGLFLWVAWPALIPWYAIRTRGKHGLPLGLLVVLATMAPFLLSVVIETIRFYKSP